MLLSPYIARELCIWQKGSDNFMHAAYLEHWQL